MTIRLLSPALIAGAVLLGGCSSGAAQARLRVDTLVRHQVLTGWEAHVQSGHGDTSWPTVAQRVLDLAVDSVGINRIRLEVKSSTENHRSVVEDLRTGRVQGYRCHRWRNENDNADPNVFDWSGFQFDAIDQDVERVILPLRDRLRARGESLVVNLLHTAFVDQCDPRIPYVHRDPEEYAELMLATFIHLRDKYQLVPQILEIILEPDNTPWDGTMIGRAAVAASRRLAAAGFHPDIAAPSVSHAGRLMRYLAPMLAVPGAREVVKELTYHRYEGPTLSRNELPRIGALGRRYGWRTAMLEQIGADHRMLEEDLGVAGVSSWQQFTLAFPESDNGAQYIVIDRGQARLGRITRFLRQYFLYLRLGTQRVDVSGGSGTVSPLAFQRPDRGIVVVVRTTRRAEVAISGLSAGSYHVTWTTQNDEGAMGPLEADSAGTVNVTMPGEGVLTLFAAGRPPAPPAR